MSENNSKSFVLCFGVHIQSGIRYTAIYNIQHIFVYYVLVILKTVCGHYYSFLCGWKSGIIEKSCDKPRMTNNKQQAKHSGLYLLTPRFFLTERIFL